MLKNICASFFMKFLVSFLHEKRKLDLFRYNKKSIYKEFVEKKVKNKSVIILCGSLLFS